MSSQETGIAIGMMVFLSIYYFVAVGFSIASYIISSLAYYRIASRRGISGAWLAWIPVAKVWTQGKIAQEYDSRLIGIRRKWNVYLLVLNLVVYASAIIMYVSMIGIAISKAITAYSNGEGGYVMADGEVLSLILPMYGFIFVIAFLGVALNTCNYISLYKVFESTVPEKSLKYMILSLMVPLALPICLLKCSNRAFNEVGTNFLWKSEGAAAAQSIAVAESSQIVTAPENTDSSAE